MRTFGKFIKTTLVGGVLFLVPIAAAIVILDKALKFTSRMLQPIEHAMPVRTILGIAFADVFAIIALLAIGFFAGLVAQTAVGKRVSEKIESLILGKVPGYTLLKGVLEDPKTMGSQAQLKTALANIDDAWLIAFIVEEHADGNLIVFVPSAPTPAAGNVYLMEERQVKRLDVPVASAVKCIMQLGVGAGKLLHQEPPTGPMTFRAGA